MAVCGCGEQLAGSPPILDGGPADDLGIIISGTFDNTIVTAVAGTAWRPLPADDFTLTNFALGTEGEFDARYLYDGFNLDLIMSFKFGSDSTFGGGTWSVALPWVPQDMTGVIQGHAVLGPWSAFDASTGDFWQGFVYRAASGNLAFRFGDDLAGTNGAVTQGTPFTFATDDELSFIVRFEADSN